LSILRNPPRTPDPRWDVPDLTPVREMDPYKPCWCGSGVKWKWCHKVRHLEPRPRCAQMMNDLMEDAKKGFCLHPDAPRECGRRIIRSHTVQRLGGLRAIAERGHVLSPKEGARRLPENGGKMVPIRVGINHASTFMGFCEKHDASLFRPIEHGEVNIGSETAFLLSFRAVAYEGFAKILMLRRDEIDRKRDAGQPFEAQAEIQLMRHWAAIGTARAVDDFNVWKSAYDTAFKSSEYSNFWYYIIEFDRILPLAVCGGFIPEFDALGAPMQTFSGPPGLDHLAFNVTAMGNRTVAAFGWMGTPDGPSAHFVRSLASLPASALANEMVQLTFEHIENCYLRPSWWDNLPLNMRQSLINRMMHGLPMHDRPANCLVPDGIEYIPHVEVKGIHHNIPEL
jgi:hypothetical protein